MRTLLPAFILILSSSALAQSDSYKFPEKMALVMGSDHPKKDDHRDDFVQKSNVIAANALKQSGYFVQNFYGNTSMAKDLYSSKQLTLPNVKPFTLSNVKETLTRVYSADCENRPAQLLIDLNAHGSQNLNGVERHTINTVDESNQSVRIPVDEIAGHIRSLKKDDCERPKLAVIDSSCKSGGSLEVFSDLGCVLTTSSNVGATRAAYAQKMYEAIGRDKGKSLDQLHLEFLLTPNYDLYKEEYKSIDKTVLVKELVNENQISGCEDQGTFGYQNFTAGDKKKEISMCSDSYLFQHDKLDLEVSAVSKILQKYNSKNDLDRDTLAGILKVPKDSIPKASEISENIQRIQERNDEIKSQMKDLLQKESELSEKMNNKSVSCTIPTGRRRESSESKIVSNKPLLKEHIEAFCSIYYDRPDKFKACAASAGLGKINLELTDLLKFHKKFVNNEDKIVAAIPASLMQSYNSKTNPELVGFEQYMLKIMKDVATNCISDLKSSADPAMQGIANFYSQNYMDKNCNPEKLSIACATKETKKLSEELKRNFGLARAYTFLSCRNNTTTPNPDLKKCENFKI